MTGNHIPLLPYAILEMYLVGLFEEKQNVGIIKDFELLTISQLQTKASQQIIQHVTLNLPHYRDQRMSIIWVSERLGILYIGEVPETQHEYGFSVRYISSERNG